MAGENERFPAKALESASAKRTNRRIASLAILLFFTPLSALAQDSPQFSACAAKAKTQTAMTVCASDEAALVDFQLSRVLNEVLSAAARAHGAVPKIRAAQRAWTVYRDAYMEAMFPAEDKQAEYGSSYAMEADLLRARLTQRQIAALKDLLGQYTPR